MELNLPLMSPVVSPSIVPQGEPLSLPLGFGSGFALSLWNQGLSSEQLFLLHLTSAGSTRVAACSDTVFIRIAVEYASV